jgi:hypothetical protein
VSPDSCENVFIIWALAQMNEKRWLTLHKQELEASVYPWRRLWMPRGFSGASP